MNKIIKIIEAIDYTNYSGREVKGDILQIIKLNLKRKMKGGKK